MAALADDIAYDNHDIDDGLRSGLLAFDALLSVPFIAAHWARVCGRLPDVPQPARVRELIREMIGVMVNDLIITSAAAIAAADPQSPDDVRRFAAPLIRFSADMAEAERQVKAMLYRELYRSAPVAALQMQARDVVAALFAHYQAHPEHLPEGWAVRVPRHEPARTRHISDFIAGMTDGYALARYAEWIGPPPMMAGF